MLSELLYVDDLVLMSETFDGLKNKFLKWKAFERNCLVTSIDVSTMHQKFSG